MRSVGLAAVALIVALWGCGGARAIHLDLVAAPSLNADDAGAGLPVVVRIYQLRAKDRLEQADFSSLWKSDRDVLQDDLIDRQEVTVHPGATLALDISRTKHPNFVAVMALFRKPEGTGWRQIIALQDRKVRSIRIEAHERRLDVSGVN